MCGIVGHVGLANSVKKVLAGLQRLEYRGYDSAGVCYKDLQGQLHLYKKTGKLENLQRLLATRDLDNTHACIGHTRWATHGEVNDTNAHPHLAEHIGLVHNGIIENSDRLKKMLMAEGIKFTTETDTEVFLALIVRLLRQGQDLLTAVRLSFQQVEGNSAFLVLDKNRDEIIAVRRGAPLVVGSFGTELFVSSDPYALIGMADRIYFPADEVLAVLDITTPELLNFYGPDGRPSQDFVTKPLEMSLEIAEKGPFEHYMLKEIHEQPFLIRSLALYYRNLPTMPLENLPRPPRLHLVACGTAYHAGLVLKDLLEKNLLPCEVALASEFRYRQPLMHKNDLAVFISQSGETADTIGALEVCRQLGITTLALVNVEGSSLYRLSDYHLLIRAGMEIGVASTKAFTQQVLAGNILSLILAGKRFTPEHFAQFDLLARRLEQLLAHADHIYQVALAIYQYKGFIFTGRGIYYPIALEGALKLKEIAYVHAEGYAAGELKHGPIALIDPEMVNVAIVGPQLYDKTISNIKEVKARRGIVVGIGPTGDELLMEICDYYLPLDFIDLEPALAPVYVNVVNQLLAYYVAKLKGTDIDKPRNLAKSVTVE